MAELGDTPAAGAGDLGDEAAHMEAFHEARELRAAPGIGGRGRARGDGAAAASEFGRSDNFPPVVAPSLILPLFACHVRCDRREVRGRRFSLAFQGGEVRTAWVHISTPARNTGASSPHSASSGEYSSYSGTAAVKGTLN